MSHIGFRSEHGDAKVGGRERAHCHIFVQRLVEAVADLPRRIQWMKEPRLSRALAVLGLKGKGDLQFFLSAGIKTTRTVAGREWDVFGLVANTGFVIGSDAVRLLARVHSTCEVHGWVDGPNRAWLAGLIEQALTSGVLREETQGYGRGWRDVIDMLRSRDDGPVVMDYSVTDTFGSVRPGRNDSEKCACGEEDDAPECACCTADGAWGDLEADERWAQSIAYLREEAHPDMEMRPDRWAVPIFGEGETVFDLLRAVDAALGPSEDGSLFL